MKRVLALASILILAVSLMSACGGGDTAATVTEQGGSIPTTSSNTYSGGDGSDGSMTFYSNGLDQNGFFEGIRALDYVTLFDYMAVRVPSDVHQVSDDALQEEIDYRLSEYSSATPVYDRAVEDGDTVNIDYVGSVDGVPFTGGSTDGAGTDVTAGSTEYIDDFLTQIIGHKPGDKLDVEVTFPDEYPNNPDLAGKDAVFDTTINFIHGETTTPELTDEFVSSTFSASDGWTTVAEFRSGVQEQLREQNIQGYINEQMVSLCTISTVPESAIQYFENTMLGSFRSQAVNYGITLAEMLEYEGVETEAQLLEEYYEDNAESARFALIIQAIAEKEGLSVNEQDMSRILAKYYGADDYTFYTDSYGLPSVKQVVMSHIIVDLITESAILD